MTGYQYSSWSARLAEAVLQPATAGKACQASAAPTQASAMPRGRKPRAASGSSSSGVPMSRISRSMLPPSGDETMKAPAATAP